VGRHQPHLLVTLPEAGAVIDIDNETRHHLERVLRYPDGGPISYTDGAGLLGEGWWRDRVVVRGAERMRQRPWSLTVAVAPPHSSSRVRFLVEKLAELGVGRLLWLRTEFGQGKPARPEKAAAWARAALEQSRGVWLLAVAGPVTIDELGQWGTPVFADQEGAGLDDLGHIGDPVLCVGPEGGFSPGEIPVSLPRVRLGDAVLRVETAAIAGAAMLLSRRAEWQRGS
jgi:16S rRNA (uracil1498-N3)-methyltransferase